METELLSESAYNESHHKESSRLCRYFHNIISFLISIFCCCCSIKASDLISSSSCYTEREFIGGDSSNNVVIEKNEKPEKQASESEPLQNQCTTHQQSFIRYKDNDQTIAIATHSKKSNISKKPQLGFWKWIGKQNSNDSNDQTDHLGQKTPLKANNNNNDQISHENKDNKDNIQSKNKVHSNQDMKIDSLKPAITNNKELCQKGKDAAKEIDSQVQKNQSLVKVMNSNNQNNPPESAIPIPTNSRETEGEIINITMGADSSSFDANSTRIGLNSVINSEMNSNCSSLNTSVTSEVQNIYTKPSFPKSFDRKVSFQVDQIVLDAGIIAEEPEISFLNHEREEQEQEQEQELEKQIVENSKEIDIKNRISQETPKIEVTIPESKESNTQAQRKNLNRRSSLDSQTIIDTNTGHRIANSTFAREQLKKMKAEALKVIQAAHYSHTYHKPALFRESFAAFNDTLALISGSNFYKKQQKSVTQKVKKQTKIMNNQNYLRHRQSIDMYNLTYSKLKKLQHLDNCTQEITSESRSESDNNCVSEKKNVQSNDVVQSNSNCNNKNNERDFSKKVDISMFGGNGRQQKYMSPLPENREAAKADVNVMSESVNNLDKLWSGFVQ